MSEFEPRVRVDPAAGSPAQNLELAPVGSLERQSIYPLELGELEPLRLVRSEFVREVNGWVSMYQHPASGAQIVAISNSDSNKVFGIAFNTLPSDSTGVAHILEHSVLCGSRRFPLKEPFVELLKGSLNTFANAFTSSDSTFYPVASTNQTDFLNQMRVYLDAVFHPLLHENAFRQEGWSYTVGAAGQLAIKGVVYNEMKDSIERPVGILYRACLKALFPNSPYANDAGGHPTKIRELTFEQFRRFHSEHYAPANAYVYLYGDFEPGETLALVNQYLTEREPGRPIAVGPLTVDATGPIEVRDVYSVSREAESSNRAKSYVASAWALGEPTDHKTTIAFGALEQVLLGSSTAPVARALLESGLGDSLVLSGFSGDLKEHLFFLGLSGVSLENQSAAFALMNATLRDLVRDGIHPDDVQAGLNSFEFALRENDTGGSPQGMRHMELAFDAWRYGRDPVEAIQYETALSAIRDELKANPLYFEELIERFLLANPRRANVVLDPDPTKGERADLEEQQYLRGVRSAMADTDLARVRQVEDEVREYAQRQDSPNALAALPRLSVADLNRRAELLPGTVERIGGVCVHSSEIATSGISYLSLSFELADELIRLAPVFGGALTRLGTVGEGHVEFGRRISIETGGGELHGDVRLLKSHPDGKPIVKFVVGGAALQGSEDKLIGFMLDALKQLDLDQRERFREVVLESVAGLERSLAHNGHRFVRTRAAAGLSPVAAVREDLHGFEQLEFLRQLLLRIDNDWSGVRTDLVAFRNSLTAGDGFSLHMTGEPGRYGELKPELEKLVAAFPAHSVHASARAPAVHVGIEGLAIPERINFVGRALKLESPDSLVNGAYAVVLKHLNLDYLWNEVRVKGGAYGCSAELDPYNNVLTFGSYRDPNIARTLTVYEQIAESLERVDLSRGQIDALIVGTISDLDSPTLPRARGEKAYANYLAGLSDAERQRYREQLLSTGIEDFRRFGRMLKMAADSRTVVLGSREALMAWKAESGSEVEIRDLL